MGCNDEAWAVFWCSLLSPLLLEEIPHGKRERYFHQLSREQGQLEAEVRAGDVLTLDHLNEVLAARLQTAYHRQVHSETGQSPHDRYLAHSPHISNESGLIKKAKDPRKTRV